jgi:hypothetical protein
MRELARGPMGNYERTKPLRNGAVVPTPADGTIYAVLGTAGAQLYQSGTDFWTEKPETTHCFAIMRVRRNLLTFNAYRSDGSALDSFTITK